MLPRTGILLALAFVAVGGSAVSQIGPGSVSLRWTGSVGGTAGTICGGFACVPDSITITGGETVLLDVRGKYLGTYFVGLAPAATSCISFPGTYNSLALDPPISLLFAGTLAQLEPIAACPGGLASITVLAPPGLPAGATFAIQALCESFDATPGPVFAFTKPIRATIV